MCMPPGKKQSVCKGRQSEMRRSAVQAAKSKVHGQGRVWFLFWQCLFLPSTLFCPHTDMPSYGVSATQKFNRQVGKGREEEIVPSFSFLCGRQGQKDVCRWCV